MEHDHDDIEPSDGARPRAFVNLGASLLAFIFIWVVFDNFALAFLLAVFVGGGSEVAQRAANKKSD